MFSPSHTRISPSQAFQVYFIVECFQIPDLAARLLQHNPLGRWRLYVIALASVWGQLALGLLYMNALAIEGSQIIAFLAYQPLTLPPQIALSPTPFFRLLLAITYHT